MKMFIATLVMSLPTLALAQGSVSASQAASMIRQPGVEKCLSIVENNIKGAAQFSAITEVSTKLGDSYSISRYKLEGNNVHGDIVAGYWEISVEVHSAEEGQTYSCNIVQNVE